MLLLNDDYYQMLFGCLEYSSNNYEIETGKKKHEFLDFLERDAKFKIVDPSMNDNNFEDLVKIRFRLGLLMDFVTLTSRLVWIGETQRMSLSTVSQFLSDYGFFGRPFVRHTHQPRSSSQSFIS